MLIRGELSRAGKRKKKKKAHNGGDRSDSYDAYFAVELPADQATHPSQALTHFSIMGYPDRDKNN
jgi:hypothetical protein